MITRYALNIKNLIEFDQISVVNCCCG